jgi:hypothetical protein
MKNIALKLYLSLFCFLFNLVLFAQPGDDNAGGDLEGNDDPAAPINEKIILLLIAGLVFAFYTFKKYRTQKHC